MVASVNDKFINVSAHTSYLYLVKERISTDCISRSVPHNETAAKPSRIAAPDDSENSESPPGAGRAAHYTMGPKTPSIQNQNSILRSFPVGGRQADGSAGQEAHYRGCILCVKNYFRFSCNKAKLLRPPCALSAAWWPPALIIQREIRCRPTKLLSPGAGESDPVAGHHKRRGMFVVKG